MPAERIVIVGAGPAGFATAKAYREHGGEGTLTLLAEEPLLPYERPPLTKEFLRGELDRGELTIEGERWFAEHQVQVRLATRATAIDPRAGTVTLAGGELLDVDMTVLATGSQPLRPALPGIDHPAVMTVRTLSDSVAISKRAGGERPIVVIGMGFIGCEIAASLAMRGSPVKLIGQEPLPQIERLGEQAAQRIGGFVEELGVELIGGATVSAVHDGRTVELQDGTLVRGTCVVLGMGVSPRGELAEAAGLQTHDGAVVVDAAMRAPSTEGSVLAVGDVAFAYNASAGRSLRVEHWGDALGHGQIAGQTLTRIDAQWNSVPGFWSTIGHRTLKYAAWGDGYDETHLSSHAGGGFTVWYSRGGEAVGVLSHECDRDYERGRDLIHRREPVP